MGAVLNVGVSRLLRAALPGLALLGACAPDGVDVPAPPARLEELVAIYDQPTGTVPVDDVSMAVAEAQRRFQSLELGRLPEVVVELTAGLRRRLQAADLSTDPQEIPEDTYPDVDGYVNVDRVCRGWDQQANTPDPASNGRVQGTVTVHNGKLDQALWATATTCRDRIPAGSPLQANVYLDGKLAIHLESELPDSVTNAQVLVGFEGTAGSEGEQRALSFDFRLDFPRLQVRVPVADGDIVAEVGSGEGLVLSGRNGSFTCNIQNGGCGGPVESRGSGPP